MPKIAKHLLYVLLICILVFQCIFIIYLRKVNEVQADGTTYYIRANGDFWDCNGLFDVDYAEAIAPNCAWSQSGQVLDGGKPEISGGDIVHFAAGTYNLTNSLAIRIPNVTVTGPEWIGLYDAPQAIFDGTNAVTPGNAPGQQPCGISIYEDNVTVSNFLIRNFWDNGISMSQDVNDVVINNNYVTGNAKGIVIPGAMEAGASLRVTIANNIVTDSPGQQPLPPQIWQEPPGGFSYEPGYGIFLGLSSFGSIGTGVVIKNNTIYSNNANGVTVNDPTSMPIITNNIIVANSGDGINNNSGTIYAFSEYNSIYNNTGNNAGTVLDYTFDCLLTNPANGDFTLQANSPCIDAGDPTDACAAEPQPNGDRINLGAYGNTVLATATPRAANVYVASNGNNAYDGSSATYVSGRVGPKASILSCLRLVADSGVCHVSDGAYNETNITWPYSSINLAGINGAGNATINGNGNGSVLTLNNVDNNTISGITVTNGNKGLIISGTSNNNTISDAVISSNSQFNIEHSSSGTNILDNTDFEYSDWPAKTSITSSGRLEISYDIYAQTLDLDALPVQECSVLIRNNTGEQLTLLSTDITGLTPHYPVNVFDLTSAGVENNINDLTVLASHPAYLEINPQVITLTEPDTLVSFTNLEEARRYLEQPEPPLEEIEEEPEEDGEINEDEDENEDGVEEIIEEGQEEPIEDEEIDEAIDENGPSVNSGFNEDEDENLNNENENEEMVQNEDGPENEGVEGSKNQEPEKEAEINQSREELAIESDAESSWRRRELVQQAQQEVNKEIIKKIPPSPPEILLPTNNIYLNVADLIIQGLAISDQKVSILMDGQEVVQTTLVEENKFNLTLAAPLSDGQHIIKARGILESEPVTFILDRVAPQAPKITQINFKEKSFQLSQNNFKVNFILDGLVPEEELSGINYLTIHVFSEPIEINFKPEKTQWQQAFNLELGPGSHYFYLTAADLASNVSEASEKYYFDLIVPECGDGLDNDNDDNTDYPADQGCASELDEQEKGEKVLERITENITTISTAVAVRVAKSTAKAWQKTVATGQKTVASVAGLEELITEKVFNNPQVEVVNQRVVVPAVTVVAVVNTATGIAWFNFLTYLRYLVYLFTEPLRILRRQKRKPWGTVYDALTKNPLDLSIVRLIDAVKKNIVQTSVTDRGGRYYFLPPVGQYLIDVKRKDYLFPSKLLSDKINDYSYSDLYHGEVINTQSQEQALNYNIPLDSVAFVQNVKRIILKQKLSQFQYLLAVIGPIAALIILAISPSWLYLALLALHLIFYWIFGVLAKPKKIKNWGMVYDQENKRPIKNVLVRLFESEANKMVGLQITDSKGRYGFLVGNNTVYVTVEKPGYQIFKSNIIDFKKDREDKFIKLDIALVK